MESDWLFSNEDEVDETELEVALYSQIHFDSVTDNLTPTTSAGNKDKLDLDFVKPSFQVKVRNYIREKTKKSSTKKIEAKKPPVYNCDFISLSTVAEPNESDGSGTNDFVEEDKIHKEDKQLSMPECLPDITSRFHQGSDKSMCDITISKGVKSPLEEKYVCCSPISVCDISSDAGFVENKDTSIQGETPTSKLGHSTIIISDSEESCNGDKEKTHQSKMPASPSGHPTTRVCDSDSDDDDEEESHTQTVVLSYHRDSENCDSDSDAGEVDNKGKIQKGRSPHVVRKRHQNSGSESNNENESLSSPAEMLKNECGSAFIDNKIKNTSLDSDKDCVQDEKHGDQEPQSEENMDEENAEESSSEAAFSSGEASEEMDSGQKDQEIGTGAATEDGVTTSKSGETDKKWAINEDDRIASKTPVNRYFNPNKIRCRNCNEEGHLALNCTKEKKFRCIFCGLEGHRHFDCPSAICFKCGSPGHKPSECTEARRNRYTECYRCWMKGHIGKACPDSWRQFHRTIGLDSSRIVKANVKQNSRIYCYNCGEEGHLGFECDGEKMGLYVYPSYPFVAEYDTGRIKRDSHRDREYNKERQKDSSHRRDKHKEGHGESYYRGEGYKDKRDSSPYKRDHSLEKRDESFHRREKQKGKRDDSFHKRERQKEDSFHTKDKKYKQKNDDSFHRQEELEEKQDDGHNINKKQKEKKDKSLHRDRKRKAAQDVDSHLSGEQERQHGKKGEKKRKSEGSEGKERKVSKHSRQDTTNGLEDLRIQINRDQSPSHKDSSKKSKSKAKKKKDVEKERDLPEPYISGSSVFKYQEPVHSKYADIANSFTDMQPIENRYDSHHHDDFTWKRDYKSHHNSNEETRKGKRKRAKSDQRELVAEEGEIIDDDSDPIFIDHEPSKPPAMKRRKYKGKHKPQITFIGLMD